MKTIKNMDSVSDIDKTSWPPAIVQPDHVQAEVKRETMLSFVMGLIVSISFYAIVTAWIFTKLAFPIEKEYGSTKSLAIFTIYIILITSICLIAVKRRSTSQPLFSKGLLYGSMLSVIVFYHTMDVEKLISLSRPSE